MSLITFSCADPSASWSPTHNPNYGDGNERLIRRHQPKGRCGADVYSYNKGSSEPVYLKWSNMPTDDLEDLQAFVSAVSGAATAFTYTDEYGSAHTARLAVPAALKHRHSQSGRHEVSVELEVS